LAAEEQSNQSDDSDKAASQRHGAGTAENEVERTVAVSTSTSGKGRRGRKVLIRAMCRRSSSAAEGPEQTDLGRSSVSK